MEVDGMAFLEETVLSLHFHVSEGPQVYLLLPFGATGSQRSAWLGSSQGLKKLRR